MFNGGLIILVAFFAATICINLAIREEIDSIFGNPPQFSTGMAIICIGFLSLVGSLSLSIGVGGIVHSIFY